MSDYIENKQNSDYVLKHLRKFHIPMVRETSERQSKEICNEIDSIVNTLNALKKKLTTK